MKRLLILSILSLLLFSSCGWIEEHFKDKLTSSWKFSHMDNPPDGAVVLLMEESDMEENPDSNLNNPRRDLPKNNLLIIDGINREFHDGYLRLYDDHKYTFLGKNISAMHSWDFNKSDSTLILDSFANVYEVRLKIVENDREWLKMNLTGIGKREIDGSHHTLLFRNDPQFEYANTDLLSYPLNTWRVKPTHKETHDEIMKRVKAHVDFLIAYYQVIEDDHRSSFAPMYLQSAFKFYQNGMAIDNDAYTQYSWQSCFYDIDDAKAGQKILVEALNGMGEYPDAKSYTEGYLKALKKMKEFLEKIN